ncbi:MAG: hypothetical protein IT384_29490 [Deltaproteobacteria bacterium]|nr:hypothetical protein [Deltaproteobacteria bacterium]
MTLCSAPRSLWPLLGIGIGIGLLGACSTAQPIEGCPPGAVLAQGQCRPTCTRSAECLATERCDLTLGACVLNTGNLDATTGGGDGGWTGGDAASTDGGVDRPDAGGPAGDGGAPSDSSPNPDGSVVVVVDAQVGPDIGAALTAQPDPIDFGSVPIGCDPPPRDLVLINSGGAGLDVTRAELVSASGELAIIQSPLPRFLSGGQLVTLRIGFAPAVPGPKGGIVTIDYQPSSGPLEVQVLGTGTARSAHEVFVTPFDQADILFIVDDSASMETTQGLLANRLQALFGHLAASKIEWQIGVTTTSMDALGPAGALIGTPRILTMGREDLLASRVQPGTNGSGFEEGLAAAQAAVTQPLISGANAGFLRGDASLTVIILSDEEDQSAGEPPALVAAIRAAKGTGRTALTRINAIVGTQAQNCALLTSVGTRYIEAAAITGGVVADICAQDWSPALTSLAPSAVQRQTTFVLSARPDVSSLRVTTGGGGAAGAWRYDSSQNAVLFDPASAPPHGAQVEVDYLTACP